MFGNARNAVGILSGLMNARDFMNNTGITDKIMKFGADFRDRPTPLERAAARTDADERSRVAYFRDAAIKQFRDMGQDQWMTMSPRELSDNVREYRAHLLDDAFEKKVEGADRNDPNTRNARSAIASMRKVNENPDQFPILSNNSIGLSKNMSSNNLFSKEDGEMMGNLTELLQHRARQQQRSSQKGNQR